MPVILCGGRPAIVNAAKAAYLPEYEVIHTIIGAPVGVQELPILLAGKVPPPSETNFGTKNYANPAAVVIVGAGYDDEAWELMRTACKGISQVPWMRADMEKPRPALGPGYGEHMVVRSKECMQMLISEGKLGKDGEFYF